MIYIKLEEQDIDYENQNFIVRIVNKLIFRIKSRFSKIIIQNYENDTIIILPNLYNRILNKLNYFINKNCITMVCISNNLLENNIILNFLKEKNIKILDGRWLFKHLAIKCTQYIAENKKEILSKQEISILSNDISDIVVYVIRRLGELVKVINILTENEYKFRKIEKELFEQKGIIINMNNNFKKSLQKSDIILNFDFNESKINKYVLPKRCCIINFNNKIEIFSKSFEGINVNFYEISLPRKYINHLTYLTDFNISMLYESFIYKNTSPSNIIKEIEKDEVEITFLEGKNGKIRKKEYINLDENKSKIL